MNTLCGKLVRLVISKCRSIFKHEPPTVVYRLKGDFVVLVSSTRLDILRISQCAKTLLLRAASFRSVPITANAYVNWIDWSHWGAVLSCRTNSFAQTLVNFGSVE